MKLLKVQLKYGDTDKVVETLICGRLDATSRITILSESVMVGKKCQPHDYHLAYEIDHWNIIEGMVTVYYKNGLIMEVTRINPKNEPEIVKLTMRHFYLSETDR